MKIGKYFVEELKYELVGKGLMTGAEFQRTVEESERKHQSLAGVLFRSGRVSERDLVRALHQIYGYPTVSVETYAIEPEILKLIPERVARRYHVLPLTRYESTLRVAVADPTNLRALDDLHGLVGMRIKPALAPPRSIDEAIEKSYGFVGQRLGGEDPAEILKRLVESARSQLMSKSVAKRKGDVSNLLEEANASPIVQFVNHMLLEGIRRRASDIFVEPWERTLRIRYRVDGSLEEILTAPRTLVDAIVSRIKVMSRLNIAEHRMPQDGRFKARVMGREIDFRVSILPTTFGEKACLRILDSTVEVQSLETLGFGAADLEIMNHSAAKPHGMVLLTGPTGSGKTTTLYAILKMLDSPEKNITTVEDPVEYQVYGINQVNVREKIGLDFPIALRSILRQDPNIILIGEIRDQVTMEIAVKAALTGHLVLSTLHTNDATSAIVRMINMGIEPFLIASSVLMISAQRLVRKACTSCRIAYKPEPLLLEALGLPSGEKGPFYRAPGCGHCRLSGFQGRTVITEIFELNPTIRNLIMRGAASDEIREKARGLGMSTLRENGIQKMKEGITSAEEILRVTSAESLSRSKEDRRP